MLSKTEAFAGGAAACCQRLMPLLAVLPHAAACCQSLMQLLPHGRQVYMSVPNEEHRWHFVPEFNSQACNLRRDCRYNDIHSPSMLKHLLRGEGSAAE